MSDNGSSSARYQAMVRWLRLHRVATFTLAAAVVTASCPYWAPSVTWLAFASLLGGAAVLATSRAADDGILMRVVTASFLLRCCLALILFAVSSSRFPLMQSLQREYGLWEFGIDGVGFHEYAVKIVGAMQHTTELPPIPEVMPFAAPIAAVYGLLGASPLHFILVNAWLGAMCGLLAYLLTCRIGGGRSAALVAAAVIAFWPSSLIWSTQLLKESSVLALILCALLVLAALRQTYSEIPTTSRRAFVGVWRWGALAAVVFALTLLRSHVGVALAVAVAAVLVPALVRASLRRRWRCALAAGGIVGTVVVATAAATSIDLVALSSPFHPEVGYVRLAEGYEQEGRFGVAVPAYRRAIELNPDYVPAYRGLVLAMIDDWDIGNVGASFRFIGSALAQYLLVETDETQREAMARRMPYLAAPESTASEILPPTQVVPGSEPRPATDAVGIPTRSVRVETDETQREAVARRMPSRAAPESTASEILPPTQTAPASEPRPAADAVGIPTRSVRDAWTNTVGVVGERVQRIFARVSGLRRAQVFGGGGRLVDTTTFDSWSGVLLYLPRALVLAFLAPFPWDLMSTAGSTGVLRPISAIEALLIALFVPAIVMGVWQALRTLRPETSVMILFIVGTALGYGLIVANGGMLFRVRLQFLFPALILASTALPRFVYRWLGALTPANPASPRTMART